jgi:hypothetical protein
MLLADYARERLGPMPAVMLWIAVRAAHPWQGAAAAGLDLVQMALLFVQFRLWDDMADRHQDRIAHPDRVLPRARSTMPFLATWGVLAIVNGALILTRPGARDALLVFGTLVIALAGWYARRGARSAVGDHFLLTKYPAIVVIVCGGVWEVASWNGLLTLGVVYLAACVHEAWHDADAPFTWRTRTSEAVLLLMCLATFVAAILRGVR